MSIDAVAEVQRPIDVFDERQENLCLCRVDGSLQGREGGKVNACLIKCPGGIEAGEFCDVFQYQVPIQLVKGGAGVTQSGKL